MRTTIGYNPKITSMLLLLRHRIDIMLESPMPEFSPSSQEPSIHDPRFDIIIGNVGLKDLSNVEPEPKGLPGMDQWPNVTMAERDADEYLESIAQNRAALPSRSLATPSESPERVETADECPPPCLAKTNPEASFRKFFRFRGMTEKHLVGSFRGIMAGETGIHVHLMDMFWDVEGFKDSFVEFMDFVHHNKVPVKVTWTPRNPGGGFGFCFFPCDPNECTLAWEKTGGIHYDGLMPSLRASFIQSSKDKPETADGAFLREFSGHFGFSYDPDNPMEELRMFFRAGYEAGRKAK